MNNDLLSILDQRIASFRSLQVIDGYYLVLGGGKIGSDFVRYAKEKSFPFVVIIDVDEGAEASKSSIVVDRDDFFRLIRTYRDSKEKNNNVYFHCMDVCDVPMILEAGIPEYIIPAVPTHAVANIAIDMLGSVCSRPLISNLHIDGQDEKLVTYFYELVFYLPGKIVVFNSLPDGVIMFSYAKMGEICPDSCIGPEKYCYNFRREKPETITVYVRKLLPFYTGWVFESCQMKPGIGGLKGVDFREHMLSLMEHVKAVNEKRKTCSLGNRIFFIATTCNCHGILNLLEVV